MQSTRHYSITLAEDLAVPSPDAAWEGTLSVERIVDAALIEAFRRTKLAPPRPEIRVNRALEPSQVEIATRDGLKAVFDAPGPGEVWCLSPERVPSSASALLFGLEGWVQAADEDGGPEFRLERVALLDLLARHLITTRGLALADTGCLAQLADSSLGKRANAGDEPSPQAQALAQWARSMFSVGVPELTTVELLDVGRAVGAHEAGSAELRDGALRAGIERLAAGWPRLVGQRSLDLFEVSAELCEQLASKEAAERQRSQAALRAQLALIMQRIPGALSRPGLLAIEAGASEEAVWSFLLHPDLAGLPKSSMDMADYSEVAARRRCVLGAPEAPRAAAA
jgi:hypothetical protein